MIANVSTGDLVVLGSRLVGATFLWAATIKAIAPHTFSRHLAALGWIPGKFNSSAVNVAAGLEALLGTALIVNVAPAFLLPVTLLILAALTGVAVWGVKSGKTTDCGCYGGVIQPSIEQSAGLNALFALLEYGDASRRDPHRPGIHGAASPTPAIQLAAFGAARRPAAWQSHARAGARRG